MPIVKKSVHRPWMPVRKPQERRVFTNAKFYHSTQWRKLRKIKINQQPTCELCQLNNIIKPANVVDHIKPINQGGEPLDMDNLQSLCSSCHNKKSGRESKK